MRGEDGAIIVLVGLMGAGKTVVGRRLAAALKLPFFDADDQIVAAAGMNIPDIFDVYGEGAFRDLERRVIARLLKQPPHVLSLGGGAFVDPATRALIKQRGVSIWLRATVDILFERTQRRKGTRPLLDSADDPLQTLKNLMAKRYPIYALADYVVDSDLRPPEVIVERIIDLLRLPTADGGRS